MVQKKTAIHASKKKTTSGGARSSRSQKPVVGKQPRSKHQAAIQAGMFLQTDDGWSARYFDPSDLHCLDRELFG